MAYFKRIFLCFNLCLYWVAVCITIYSCSESPRKDTFIPISISGRDTADTYVRVEKAPEYVGGPDAFARCISENLLYPQEAIARRVQGRVMLSFVVEVDGELVDFQVIRDLGFGCDSAAIKAVQACSKWAPGTIGGQAVRTKMSVPVEFRL